MNKSKGPIKEALQVVEELIGSLFDVIRHRTKSRKARKWAVTGFIVAVACALALLLLSWHWLTRVEEAALAVAIFTFGGKTALRLLKK